MKINKCLNFLLYFSSGNRVVNNPSNSITINQPASPTNIEVLEMKIFALDQKITSLFELQEAVKNNTVDVKYLMDRFASAEAELTQMLKSVSCGPAHV